MKLETLKEKKILILGFAREGIESFNFLRKLFPKKEIGVGDIKEISNAILRGVSHSVRSSKFQISNLFKEDKKARPHFGKDYLKAIQNYDIIIKTPGIAPKIIAPFVSKKQRITSQTEIFFENCPGKIVGITGTKGKSTTATLIHEVLKAGGIKTHLIGNIGKPALSYLVPATKDDVYVYELSSHQLFGLKHSPHIAVFLNIYSEHGDYYQNLKEYVGAKSNIARWQTKKDYLIFNSKNKIVKKVAKYSKAQKVPLSSVNIKNIIRLSNIPLKGLFNVENVKAAIAVGNIFEIPRQKIRKAIKDFKGLPHRLEFVGIFQGINFYNDSLATIPESTIAAIDTLDKNLQTIILGGFDRGQGFEDLAKKILKSNIKNVILFPDTGKRIWKQISKIYTGPASTNGGLVRHFFVEDMKEAVKHCYKYTKRGKICLLSPASASFNLFKNYAQRGDLFKKYVNKFAKK